MTPETPKRFTIPKTGRYWLAVHIDWDAVGLQTSPIEAIFYEDDDGTIGGALAPDADPEAE